MKVFDNIQTLVQKLKIKSNLDWQMPQLKEQENSQQNLRCQGGKRHSQKSLLEMKYGTRRFYQMVIMLIFFLDQT